MGQVEVLVAPRLERGVVSLPMLIASALQGLVEMNGVLLEQVGWGQVGSTTEPARQWFGQIVRVVRLEITDVHVDGRGHGVLGMKDEGETTGGVRERGAGGDGGQDGMVRFHLGDRSRREETMNDGNVDTSFLDDLSRSEHTRGAFSTVVSSGPRVVEELGGTGGRGGRGVGDFEVLDG